MKIPNNLNSWLEQPANVNNGQLITCVGMMAIGNLMTFAGGTLALKAQERVMAKNAEKNAALQEIAHFLISEADADTVRELNDRNEFWRQVVGPARFAPKEDGK